MAVPCVTSLVMSAIVNVLGVTVIDELFGACVVMWIVCVWLVTLWAVRVVVILPGMFGASMLARFRLIRENGSFADA
jgi:hypothetical protein